MSPLAAVYVTWLLFLLSWIAAALLAGPTVKEGSFLERQFHRLIVAAGFFFLFGLYIPPYFPLNPFWHLNDTVGWCLVGATAVGFLFAWWAQVMLSRAQFAYVMAHPETAEPFKKGDMRRQEKKHVYLIVDRGPYALVRHPVSTGVLLAALSTAVLMGTLVSMTGALIMILGCWLRARSEDAVLHNVEGGAFDRYAARVPMLVPFGPKRPYETPPEQRDPEFVKPPESGPPAADDAARATATQEPGPAEGR